MKDMRSALLIFALALPAAAAAAPWNEAYSRGVDAIRAKNYAVAVDELRRAIADAPDEFISTQPRNGLTVYLPHFWLGIAEFNLGDVDGALIEWKISEEQGVVPKSPEYGAQLRGWIARAGTAKQPQLPPPTQARTERQVAVMTAAPQPVAPQPQPQPVVPPPTATAPPTPTQLPADAQPMWNANIAFNTPSEINLDEHRVIRLLLDMHLPAKELEQQLHETGPTATATIKISELVEARLTGTAFDIRAITPERQAVSADQTTEWQWEVTPKQEGQQRIFLTINAIVAGQQERSIRTFDRVIEVRVPPRTAGGWIVAASVLAAIVILAVLFVFLRRRTPPAAVDDTVPIGDKAAPKTVVVSSAATHFREGHVINERYRIVRRLGQGGMGTVYAAEDLEFGGELVALKTILAAGGDAEGLLARFKREIHLARRVAHPNVCRIFDVGYDVTAPGEKAIFVSMEYVAGVPLKSVIQQKGRLSEREALPIIRDVAAGLDATHAAGLIHRDVKSANVMLAQDGGRAVLMDFGLACLRDPSGDEPSLTRSGAIVGTPAYMAPEQIQGSAVTAAADIYAFGMVIYEMVTGRLPYEGDTPMSVLAKRLQESPTLPRELVPDLKAEWEQTILRCLEVDPSKRFRNAMEVSRTLDASPEIPTVIM